MYKYTAPLKKRADISRTAFIEYYETRHAPLIPSLLPGSARRIAEDRANMCDRLATRMVAVEERISPGGSAA